MSKLKNAVADYGLLDKLHLFGKNDYKLFTEFILFLKNSYFGSIPTKEQFKSLNELFKKLYKKQRNPQILESYIVLTYSDYVTTCYNGDDHNTLYSSIIDSLLIKDNNSHDLYKEIDKTIIKSSFILNLIDSNFKNFNNETILQISEKLLVYIFENYQKVDNECKNITDCLKLFISSVILLSRVKKDGSGNDGKLKRQIEHLELNIYKFKDQLISLSTNVITNFLNIVTGTNPENIFHYFGKSEKFVISKKTFNYLLTLFKIDQNKECDNIFYFIIFFFSNKIEQSKYSIDYKNQLIQSTFKFFFKDGNGKDGNKLGTVVIETLKNIIKILYESNQFFILNFKVLVDLLNSNQPITSSSICFIFEETPYNIAFIILLELLKCGLIKKRHIDKFINSVVSVKFSLKQRGNWDFYMVLMKSIFQINEEQFITQLYQDEYKLMEIYSTHFNSIVTCKIINMESMLPYFFQTINKSPVKFKFLKSKLNYLIQHLNLNSITHWLLPVYTNDVINSNLYQLKLSDCWVPPVSSHSSQGTVSISNLVIIKEIILKYVDCKSTSIYQKLQLSLVSKKFYEIVVNVINSSVNVPIPISDSFFDFYSIGDDGDEEDGEDKSLFRPSIVKYINYTTGISTSYLKPIFTNCKSIEIFQLNLGNKTNELNGMFNYLIWYTTTTSTIGKFKKLIITIKKDIYDSSNVQEYIKLFKLKTATCNPPIEIIISLLSPVNSFLDTSLVNEGIEFNLISNLEITSNQFSNSNGNNSFIKSISHVDNISFKFDQLSKSTYGKSLSKLKKSINESLGDGTKFNNLKSIKFEISNFCDFNFFKLLIGIFGSTIIQFPSLSEIIISKSSYKLLNYQNQLEFLFKLVSDNSKLDQITSITISNDYYNKSITHWNTINSHSFKQSTINVNSIDSIEFKRNLSNSKRKFIQIDHDSSSSDSSSSESENENEDSEDSEINYSMFDSEGDDNDDL